MNIESLYYFAELAKDLHITRTAERIHISQQTLSNHIIRLEEYYGVKLLNRHPKLSLTYAGSFVLRYAQQLIRENENLQDILADIKHSKRGLIYFGASILRSNACLPYILPIFTTKYPLIELELKEATTTVLEKLVLDGDLDLAIALSQSENPNLVKQHMMRDQVYLCITDSLLKKTFHEDSEKIKKKSLQGANLADFAQLPFCILQNRLGETIQNIFKDAGITPITYMTSQYIQIATAVGASGVAVFFATRASLINQKENFTEPVNAFPLIVKGTPFVQNLQVIYHKDRYLSKACLYFKDLLLQYGKKIESMNIEELTAIK